jgi:hypothetical protein
MERSARARRRFDEDDLVGRQAAWVNCAHDAQDGSFSGRLKEVRKRRAGKQVCLSFRIGCTDAALSLWESGARLPSPRSLGRILVALTQMGATTAELLAVRGAWLGEIRRRSIGRRAVEEGE